MLRSADTDNSGQIDYTEFLAAAMDQQTYMRNDYMRTAFNMFDSDGSGSISPDELKAILSSDEMKGMFEEELLMQYL